MPRGGSKPGERRGGRQKGTINKSTASVQETLRRLKCDPIEGMARLALDDKNSAELRGKMFGELAQYLWPKRKAVEHSGPGGTPIGLSVSATDEFTSRIISIASRIGTRRADSKPN